MLVGLTALEPTFVGGSLIIGRRNLAGSVIGGVPVTQEMMAQARLAVERGNRFDSRLAAPGSLAAASLR